MKIDINDLPGNSNTEKAQAIRESRKNEDDIVSPKNSVAKGRIRKKRSSAKISEVFIAEDIKSVATHVFDNLIVPRFKVLLVDTISSAARAFFLGESVIDSPRRRDPAGIVSYNSIYDSPKASVSRNTSKRFDTSELIFDSYGDAQLVLDMMDEILADSGEVTIADMYEAADRSCPFTYTYFGWTNTASAKIVSDSDGYWIKMPKARQLKEH